MLKKLLYIIILLCFLTSCSDSKKKNDPLEKDISSSQLESELAKPNLDRNADKEA